MPQTVAHTILIMVLEKTKVPENGIILNYHCVTKRQYFCANEAKQRYLLSHMRKGEEMASIFKKIKEISKTC